MTATHTGGPCFASTALDLHQAEPEENPPRDIFIGEVCYRRVDPEYFAWLRGRMESARRRFEAGGLSQTAWEELRSRFNKLQEWAIGQYGQAALKAVIRTFKPASYMPPANRRPEPEPEPEPEQFRFPKEGEFRFERTIAPDALAKVDAIREQAEALGWSEARLYQNRGRFVFPCGQDWGLVCFVGPKDALGQITETHIEIVHDWNGARNTLRFANADVWPPRIPKETVPV